uniref:D-aminoacyl-tRNA deacylase n=1 Tax=Tetraodon nigroviridis TaxID=99883 RepID=H3BXN2_TETNG
LAARTVLQQRLHARLQVRPARGALRRLSLSRIRMMNIIRCFCLSRSNEEGPPTVSTLLNLRLCEADSGKLSSLLELPGSLLIVPQATLGGKAKGRAMQYHTDISKEDGLRLHSAFVSLWEQEVAKAGPTVRHGYGNRQVLSLDTNGPSPTRCF